MFSAQIGFLSQTSYADLQQQDQQRTNSARILINAVQAAIVAHADANSSWWKSNRERIALNHECALRFFAIIACTKYPDANLGLIAGLLQKEIFAEADLLSEVGELLRVAFVRFDSSTQDKVTATILALGKESSSNEQWLGRVRAQLSSAIPCCLRSPQAQATVDTHKIIVGPITNQTFLITRGGMVTAPFSVDVFLKASNDDVLKLLHHYLGHDSEHDSLVGGQHQVGQQLTEAASRQPSRFLSFLQAQWNLIPPYFCDCVLNGMAIYLAYRYGNSTPQPNWKPLEDPELSNFVSQVLEELEKHSEIWLQLESAIHALEASVHIVETNPEAQRLTVLANRITDACDESDLPDQSIDLVTQGFRMRRGRVAIALMTLATQLLKNAVLLPDILTSAMLRIAADEHPAVRALVLRHLPYVQHQDPELGWILFESVMKEAEGLWAIAEPCLYHCYQKRNETIDRLLERLYRTGKGADLETWGRISALVTVKGRTDFTAFLANLNNLDAAEAWRGAASVWGHPENLSRHTALCLDGIEAGFNADKTYAIVVANQLRKFFHSKALVSVPIALLKRCFEIFRSNAGTHPEIFGIDEWLNTSAHNDPIYALCAAEIYLNYVGQTSQDLYEHDNQLTQLLTCLFAEAEEREESDGGAMLLRVVALQDVLLGLGVSSVGDWLKAAERP